MYRFLDDNFLLYNDAARLLYHNYAEKLPIIDYHCHVSPKEIAEDKRYSNITELWLGADHYKWRAMRSDGVAEKYITGDASDYEKFRAYARAMPRLIGNPLYHWTHLELRRYFNCDKILSEKTCDEIWELTSDALATPEFSVRSLISRSSVELLCTTDDPADSLEYHKALAADTSFDTKVLPAFRPDKGLNINKPGIKAYIEKLGEAAGVAISDIKSLKDAYIKRIDYFDSLGCRTADHGFDEYAGFVKPNEYAAGLVFDKALSSDGDVTPDELAMFKTEMLRFLAREYSARGWVMQIHFGVLRNANTKMYKAIGPDTGFDCIGAGTIKIADIAALLDIFEKDGYLPRTVLYPINPSDNAAVSALIGSFQTSGDGMPKVMQGSAWWFSDTLDGMRAQMSSLASLSAFGNFLGMLTDSRSFTSYPRHEYFRRILCGLVGGWITEGLYPDDVEETAQIIADICYNNAKNFFGFKI
jgi:glucuronate isomerase